MWALYNPPISETVTHSWTLSWSMTYFMDSPLSESKVLATNTMHLSHLMAVNLKEFELN